LITFFFIIAFFNLKVFKSFYVIRGKMKILLKNLKQGIIKLAVESNDDLWYLTQLISPDDFVSGRTFRKIKVVEDAPAVKKHVFLKVSVEKLDFSPSLLRVSGRIVEGPEDVPRGQFHTFNVDVGSVITIQKSHWFAYHLRALEESLKQKGAKILICVFDREEAFFAVTKLDGYELLGKLKGRVAKKAVDEKVKDSFYSEIIRKLVEYDERFKPGSIILASPAFWREELLSQLKDDDLKKKIVQASCASGGVTAIDEVLKRDEIKAVLVEERSRQELLLLDELLAEISKGGLAAYGFVAVKDAVFCGAVASLLVSSNFITSKQEDGSFGELNGLMASVDKSRGEVHIISSDNSAGKQLDGLGGIAALLRFKVV